MEDWKKPPQSSFFPRRRGYTATAALTIKMKQMKLKNKMRIIPQIPAAY